MKGPTVVTQFMNEYVIWGGPIITRAEAYRDCKSMGLTDQEIDWILWMRPAQSPPDDPEYHVAWLREIQAMDQARKKRGTA